MGEVLPLLFLHGLSSGDFAPSLTQFPGSAAGLSPATVTRLTAQWQDDAAAFGKRSLADTDFVYMWVDEIHLKVRLEQEEVCLLVMIRVRADGTKELIALADGFRESSESWADLGSAAVTREGTSAGVTGVSPPGVTLDKRRPGPAERAHAMESDVWWQRLRRDRDARGWSQATAAKQLIAHSEHYSGFDEDSVLRTLKRWEAGQLKNVPSVENQAAIARMFGTVRSAYFPVEVDAREVARLSDDETLDLVARLRSSTVDDATLDLARATVDRLCTDYASAPGPVVLQEAQHWLRGITDLSTKSMSPRQHREVYDLGAWLSLLVACLQYDAGDERAAESARRAAVMLGTESGQAEVLGWGAEIKAWMALTQGNYYGVLAAVKEGLAATRSHSVTVQLHAQSAKAWARLGNRTRVEVALDQGRELMDSLPYPDNPGNHFQVDPAKFEFYAMDSYRSVKEDRLALAMAETVQRSSTTPAGAVVSPMRLAEAELTQATVYARAGDLEQAMTKTADAFERGRRSLPSLLLVGREVADELVQLHPGSQQAADFAHHIKVLESVH